MPSDDSRHEFGATGLTAAVVAQGAELCLLRDADALDYIWPAGPAWPRHAPVLFPIVGRLREDTLRHGGTSYRLTQHGFARDMRFAWTRRKPDGCTLALTDTPETREKYPFPFRLEIDYTARGATLETTYSVTNTGQEILPVSLGTHPAFRWPLLPGTEKQDYALVFEAEEPAPLRILAGGLLTTGQRATPIVGRQLNLAESLFTNDALILPAPVSRSVRYAAAHGPGLTLAWQGFPQLGLWSRAGGDFLCIEPWCGMASPQDFDGEFAEKPWLRLIPPGQSRTATLNISVGTHKGAIMPMPDPELT
jgi:galactose mutarotase-like enzyme